MLRRSRAPLLGMALAVLGLPAACTGTTASSGVWLDQAPHLVEIGWSPIRAGERVLRAEAPRAVLQFFAASRTSLALKLHAQAVSPPLVVRVSANGGCEIAIWDVAATRGEGAFTVPQACVKTGPNLLEFECLQGQPSSFAMEGFTMEGVATDDGRSQVEPIRIGQEIRRAVISAGSTIDVPVEVRFAGQLETSVGLSGRGWTRSVAGVSVKVSLRSARGREKVLAESTLGRGGEGMGRWTPIRADLTPYVGTTITLRLTRRTLTPPGRKKEDLAAFADPASFVSLESPTLIPAVPGKDPRPPIVLIVFDTLRFDHLPMYGYPRATSPNLVALSKDSIVFETCLSAAPWTLPSITTMLTGLYPGQHMAGLRRPQKEKFRVKDEAEFIAPFRTFRSVTRLASDVRTLGDWMQDAGYLSAAFVENSYLSDHSGLSRGFSRYQWVYDFHDHVKTPEARRRVYGGDVPAREWLDEHANARVFLFRHYISPHMPYLSIPGEEVFAKPDPDSGIGDSFEDEQGAQEGRYGPRARRRIVDLYDESIRLVDRRLGDLLAALKRNGLYDRSLIIVTSDHGEEFWDHGGFGHGHTLYQEVLRVPLIVKLPGNARGGTRVTAPARLIDIVPTVLDFIGATATSPLPGRSLFPVREEKTGFFESFAEASLYGPPRQLARRGSMELIATGPRSDRLVFGDRTGLREKPEELYDLAADPMEKRDLASSDAASLAALKRFLTEKMAGLHRASPAGSSEGLELSEEELEQLESLGYVRGPRKPGTSPAPSTTAPH